MSVCCLGLGFVGFFLVNERPEVGAWLVMLTIIGSGTDIIGTPYKEET